MGETIGKTLLLRKFKKSFLQFKKSFLQQTKKQSKLKTLFYHYPYSNNLISFKMTFIGLIFV
ncbi:hypothetical protein C2844_00150 [Helicobacter pylori]|uniref:Uncharacterized protein n=1 Tax=Helicobacter pylori TaxID=210 RepID=A0AAN1JWX1_HELPX|nr:hypothetical protein C2841_00150 [Helicobacter pylori]AUV75778.1 hypothetical protein C2843_00150 [Helicobacter pylori]AUV77253.1 hypothetical protein C2840_00150 [Helicobacter pylori]AUV78760.1 hypothetical protein C2842_00150 [Helicobacter pylori]AUZ23281.1 hypothetical protein C2844_00150 [Helicobacter pylori]